VIARENDIGANAASRLRSGKAPSHGTAIIVVGTAASGSTLRRANAEAPEAGDLDPALTPVTYGLRTIPEGFAGKDGLAVRIVREGRGIRQALRTRARFFQDAVAPGSF